eukprot:TRINITY_DN43163_c0_g1_i1.p1 TRINITY_DN43163_c0_g1~~TRINITY_DN43163_c0_g1_i1.p1  ORF type:complete len:1435 (+),score=561.37 TRINITY_DN43163_c0_g1_i1:67-4371(+)
MLAAQSSRQPDRRRSKARASVHSSRADDSDDGRRRVSQKPGRRGSMASVKEGSAERRERREKEREKDGAERWGNAVVTSTLLTRFHRGKVQPPVGTADGTFLFDQQQLVQLEMVFKSHPDQELTEREFVNAFGAVMGERSREDLRLWFMRIDANASGAIDWEEFSSYLLFQHKDAVDNGRNREFVPHLAPDERRTWRHKGQVCAVRVHDRSGTYWTASRDGTVKVWNSQTLRHLHTIDNNRAALSMKSGQPKLITDMVFSTSGTQVMVSTIDKAVNVYDTRYNHVRRYIGRKMRNELGGTRGGDLSSGRPRGCNAVDFVARLEQSSGQEDVSRADGDEAQQQGETVALLRMEEPATALEVIPSPGERDHFITGLQSGGLNMYMPGRASGREILPALEMQLHGGQITQIKHVPFLDGLLTSSWDTTLKLASYDRNMSLPPLAAPYMRLSDINRGDIVRSFTSGSFEVVRTFDNDGHRQAVCCFDWDQERKIIAACGPERDVYLWNPFINSPLAKLSGHLKNLVGLVFNSTDQQLITMSLDKCIKVWDMRTQKLFQSFFDQQEKSIDDGPFSALSFDSRQQRIVAASTCVHCWPIRRSLPNFAADYKGHADPLVSCLVAEYFGQVVTVDAGGCVQVWVLETGEREFAFTADCFDQQGRGTELTTVTTACFDTFERRLIVGDSHGGVRVFNYVNSQEIRTIQLPAPDQRREVGVAVDGAHVRQSANDVDAAQVTKLLHVAKEKNADEAHSAGPTYRVIVASAQEWLFVYRDGDVSSQKIEVALRCKHGCVTTLASAPPQNAAGAPSLIVGTLEGSIVVYNMFTAAEIVVFSRYTAGILARARIGLDTATAVTRGGSAFLTQLGGTLEEIERDMGASTDDDDVDLERFSEIMGEGHASGRKGIDDTCWLVQKGMLASVSGDTRINFWDHRVPSLVLSYRGGFETLHMKSRAQMYERLLSVETNSANDRLVTADDTGVVYVYDISELPKLGTKSLRRRMINFMSLFRAHQGSIVRMQVQGNATSGVIVTAGADLHVRVHTLSGHLIGCVGQPRPWRLADSATWLHPQRVEGPLPRKLHTLEQLNRRVEHRRQRKSTRKPRSPQQAPDAPPAGVPAGGPAAALALQRSASCPPEGGMAEGGRCNTDSPALSEPLPPTVQRGRRFPPQAVSANVFADPRKRQSADAGGHLRPTPRPQGRPLLQQHAFGEATEVRPLAPVPEPAPAELPPLNRPRRTTVADVIMQAMAAAKQGGLTLPPAQQGSAPPQRPSATPPRETVSPSSGAADGDVPMQTPCEEARGSVSSQATAPKRAAAAGSGTPPDPLLPAAPPQTPPLDIAETSMAPADGRVLSVAPPPRSRVTQSVHDRREEAKSGNPKAVGPKGFHRDSGAEWVDRAVSVLPLQGPRGFHVVPKPAAKWSPAINRIWDRKRPHRDKAKATRP